MLKKFLWALLVLWGTAQAEQPLTVMLDWLPNPDQAPLFVAEEAGIFAKHGLSVTLLNPSDASDPLKMVAVGRADIALTYQPSWLIQQNQGLPVVWIGNLIDRPLACVIVDPAQGIQQLADLRGHTIGYSSGAVDSLVLGAMLRYQGLSLTSVNLLNVHYNLTQALLTHRVAAVSGAMRNVEFIELQAQGFPAKAFYPEQNGVPPYAELIFVARNSQEARMIAFVKAIKEAIVYLKAEPDQAWALLIKHHPELDTPTNLKIYHATIPYFTDQPAYFDQAQNTRLAKFLNVPIPRA